MARQPRFEYPGAVYHVMARGNGGDAVFVTDDDRKAFLQPELYAPTNGIGRANPFVICRIDIVRHFQVDIV